MASLEFTNENLINAVHNEISLWDTHENASEEVKELAWKRISDLFGIKKGKMSSWLGQVRVVCQIPLSYHEQTQPKSWPTCCFNLDEKTSWPTHELVGQPAN